MITEGINYQPIDALLDALLESVCDFKPDTLTTENLLSLAETEIEYDNEQLGDKE